MATEALVDEEVRLGREVVEALEGASLPFRAAMWYFAPEFEDWRLLIATPLVRKEGPLKSYDKLQKVLLKRGAERRLAMNRIWLVEDDFPLVNAMAHHLHLGAIRKSDSPIARWVVCT